MLGATLDDPVPTRGAPVLPKSKLGDGLPEAMPPESNVMLAPEVPFRAPEGT